MLNPGVGAVRQLTFDEEENPALYPKDREPVLVSERKRTRPCVWKKENLFLPSEKRGRINVVSMI